jgi:hypothetical protein
MCRAGGGEKTGFPVVTTSPFQALQGHPSFLLRKNGTGRTVCFAYRNKNPKPFAAFVFHHEFPHLLGFRFFAMLF